MTQFCDEHVLAYAHQTTDPKQQNQRLAAYFILADEYLSAANALLALADDIEQPGVIALAGIVRDLHSSVPTQTR